MLRLFYSPGACSTASHIALEEAGADYEPVKVDLKAGAHLTLEYININPKSRVPALQTPQGVITENVAILAWIAQAYPQAKLAPLDDVYAFAQMQAFNSYLSSTVHVAMAMAFRASRWSDDPAAQQTMVDKAPSSSRDKFNLIEERFADGRPWVMGDAYSVADSYLVVFSAWLKNRGWAQENQFPKVSDHRRRVLERPASRKILAVEGLDWS